MVQIIDQYLDILSPSLKNPKKEFLGGVPPKKEMVFFIQTFFFVKNATFSSFFFHFLFRCFPTRQKSFYFYLFLFFKWWYFWYSSFLFKFKQIKVIILNSLFSIHSCSSLRLGFHMSRLRQMTRQFVFNLCLGITPYISHVYCTMI